MSGEPEPRRSVRSTKGQHTKSFDELELAAAMPKRRQTKKTKKALEQEKERDQEQEQEQEQEQGQDEEEVIRCVCGATEQDDDEDETWISCETCFVWQHNVCVGVSSFEDEIPEHYWCEKCKPENHKELLEGIARGEKPWEARRKAREESEKKKKKGGRKGKGKRVSDTKEEVEKDKGAKAKPSPAPEAAVKDKKDPAVPAPKQGKRKAREDSHDTDGKNPKVRRVSENEAAPVPPPAPAPVPVPVPAPAPYTPPEDIAKTIAELPSARSGPAKALKKSLVGVLSSLSKSGEYKPPADSSIEAAAEAYATQIERAVHDTHPPPAANSHQAPYTQQIKSLAFNLKKNAEITRNLVRGMHTPLTLAVSTSEQLQSAEMAQKTAEMKAKAEKQAILYTGDTRPRVRRTHKGEEVVEDEGNLISEVPPPLPGGGPRREPPRQIKHESVDSPTPDTFGQHSPSNPNFDIGKVFDSVKSQSPTTTGPVRRPSALVVDPDVDRLLEGDEPDSPPYSPTEEGPTDPDVVWKGKLVMSTIANFQAVAKHVGGANFSKAGPWSKLIPKEMTVAGRIQEQSAIEYLCGLRYSHLTDVIVVNLTPVSPESQGEFQKLIDYFLSKKRYGVVGDKVSGNVRDTYLVPVPPGEENHPEFMLNLVDNEIPKVRTEPMLLAVFVYRSEPEQIKLQAEQPKLQVATKEAPATPTPGPTQTPVPIPMPGGGTHTIPTQPLAGVAFAQRSNSVSGGPAFSPATPQGATFPPPLVNNTPVPIPQPPHTKRPPPPTPPTQSVTPVPPPVVPSASPPAHAQQPPSPHQAQMSDAQKYQAQAAGHTLAQDVLGPLIQVPTVQFILPQAYQMSRKEWEVIKGIYERDPRARDDLQYLGHLLEQSG